MPRTITWRFTTVALAAVAALTLAHASRVAFVAAAVAATAAEESDVRFAFSAAYYRVSEGESGATITVVRTGGDPGREASVEYLADLTHLGAKGCQYAGVIGSAEPDVDYARTSGALRFAAGETSKTFHVSITDDAEIELRQPESVFLSLDFSPAGPTSGAVCYGAVADLLIHDNDPAPVPPPSAPVLLTEPKTIWAIALDSVTQVTDPFGKVSSWNLSSDQRTRVSLFATGMTSPSVADITAEAEDAAGRRFQLPVEHVTPVQGVDGMIPVTVRLPDGFDGLINYVWVGLNVRGTPTNQAIIIIQNKQ